MEQTEKLAILFADISGSTQLYETLGNAGARQKVVRCIATMTTGLDTHGGRLIKTLGDEIMCTFPSAGAALRAACGMQYAVESEKPGGDMPMYIRIGFNYGEVLHEAGDVHGDAVNVAARIAEVARARQILAGQAAIETLPADLLRNTRHVRRAILKGRHEAIDLFQISWRADDVPRVGTALWRRPQHLQEQLVLRHGDQRCVVSESTAAAVLGCAESCAIAVCDGRASHRHAQVDFHLGKFVASDRSDTGTFVRFGDGEPVHLLRENIVLRGSGAISLGRPFADDAPVIEFSIQSAPGSD